MIKTFFLSAFALVALLGTTPAHAAPVIGMPAPLFTGTDSNGKEQKLSDYKGKIVVLEWTNPQCPFVKKHYGDKSMQGLQAKYTGKDVVWLSINSSAKDLEGSQTAEEANKYMTDQGSKPTARILDPNGTIGKLYAAKTTPHMFVIDKNGVLVYEGAIDDNDSPDPADKATKNYVSDAIDLLQAGKKVETAQTRPYGCSVKYAD